MPTRIRTHQGIYVRQHQNGSTVWDVVISHAGIRRRICGFLTQQEAIRARHYILAAYRRDRFLSLTLPAGWDRSPSTSSTPLNQGETSMTHPTPQPHILSVQEAGTLLAQAPAWLQGPILMSLYAGLRPTEIVGLQWTDLDLEQAQVCVSSARSTQSRLIPLSGPLVPLLQQLRKHAASSSPVFLTGQGHPLTTRTLTAALHQASQHAQLPGLRFNSLRKTFVVWAIEAKLPLVLVTKMMGTLTPALMTRGEGYMGDTHRIASILGHLQGPNKFHDLTAHILANPSAVDPGLIALYTPPTSTAESAD